MTLYSGNNPICPTVNQIWHTYLELDKIQEWAQGFVSSVVVHSREHSCFWKSLGNLVSWTLPSLNKPFKKCANRKLQDIQSEKTRTEFQASKGTIINLELLHHWSPRRKGKRWHGKDTIFFFYWTFMKFCKRHACIDTRMWTNSKQDKCSKSIPNLTKLKTERTLEGYKQNKTKQNPKHIVEMGYLNEGGLLIRSHESQKWKDS